MKKVLLLLFLLIPACSIVLNNRCPDDVNKDIINKLQKKYLKEDGNCVVATSTYCRHAFLWHYSSDSIIIDYLNNGRVVRTEKNPDSGKEKFASIKDSCEEEITYVLDGDCLDIFFIENGIHWIFPLSIRESINSEFFKTEMFRLIAIDIKKYKLFF